MRVLLPPKYRNEAVERYPVLYVNDGQDLEAVQLQATLACLYAADAIRPVIAVAIDMPPDRMAAYGLSDRGAGHGLVAQTRYGPVGSQAHAYSQWLATTLVPLVDARYRSQPAPQARTVLGWSLGALNAFNDGWQYPQVFGRVGAFSPSFWLSADRGDADAVQRTRLAQRMVDSSRMRPALKLFFAAGTDEETDDRDADGSIDVLDDTRDLLQGWSVDGKLVARGLHQLGYSVDPDWGTGVDAGTTRDDAVLYVLPGGHHDQASWARMLPVFLRWAYARHAPTLSATGRVDGYQDFQSTHVAARNIDVWLPPGYGRHPWQRYPVVYVQDGQNLFDPALSYTGTDWDIDGAMTRLVNAGKVREAIVVGIWNTPLRFQEYMPRKPVALMASVAPGIAGFPALPGAAIVSDDYLRFVVQELKPFIDATYRTRPGRDDTFVMGSSMGALVSLYAMAEYPQVFGGAAALSTHWPAGDGAMVDWLAGHLPDPGTHRVYFDHGSATLDAAYAPYQQRMDAAMRARGYRQGRHWTTRRYPGGAHNERAWRARVEVPLVFLLGNDPGD